jgi:hypothetical protein
MLGKLFQELVDSSNRYQAVLKQKEQYEFAISQMEKDRTKIQKGEIQPPFQMTVIPNVLTRVVSDKKEILAIFDEQLKTYKSMIKGLVGQVEHRYEEYIQSGTRNKDFLASRFGKIEQTAIMPVKGSVTPTEEVLFESEFKALATDPEIKAEFNKARKEAVKRNVARKTKK